MATYYVRTTGNDSNSGLTEPLAKLTIAGAFAVASDGDTINIGEGTFAEDISYAKSITYQGAGMFLTLINGRLSPTTASASTRVITLNDMKILADEAYTTSRQIQGLFTFNRVYIDMNASLDGTHTYGMFYNPTASYLTTIFNYCIVTNVYISVTSFVRNDSTTGFTTFYKCTFYNIYFSQNMGSSSASSSHNCIYISCKIRWDQWIFRSTFTDNRTYNNYYSVANVNGSYVAATGDLTSDPLLVDPANGDFRLQANSPVIGKGMVF